MTTNLKEKMTLPLEEIILIIEEKGSIRSAAKKVGVSYQAIAKRFAKLDPESELSLRYQKFCGKAGRKKSSIPLAERQRKNSQRYYHRQNS